MVCVCGLGGNQKEVNMLNINTISFGEILVS